MTFTLSLGARLSHMGSPRRSVMAVAALLGACGEEEISIAAGDSLYLLALQAYHVQTFYSLLTTAAAEKYVTSRGG